MRKILCLLTNRSLRKWLQLLDVLCELNENVLAILKTKFIGADPKQIDRDKKPRLAPKLNSIHFKLPPFSPMCVCLATQALSHTVRSGIMTLVGLNKMSKGNYDIDACQFLTKLYEIKVLSLIMKTTVNQTHQVNDKTDENYIHSLIDNHLSPTNIQSILMDEHNSSAVSYVTGWVCNNLEHSDYIDKITNRKSKDFSVTYSQDNMFIDVRTWSMFACLSHNLAQNKFYPTDNSCCTLCP
ncbi:Uncharacterized protein FWK35_00028306, partial [Aphis craccivora]